MPAGGIDAMSWQDRNNLIDDLQMQLAVAYYKVRDDIRPLQRETFRLLQKAVDKAYAEGEKEYNAGNLKSSLSREEAIGNFIDPRVRALLKKTYDVYGWLTVLPRKLR